MTDADADEIKAGKEKLMNSAQSLFAKLYEQQSAAGAGAAGAGPDMGGDQSAQQAGYTQDDNVVDGDYREV